ncbi:MAG: 1-deoxy-D-xylulose-5-phosphate reductoisomerase [Tyzzerella sp.]|uniref:1-deoxy-D-xylulose 5-phosphate reductoisomerase n=1 Tax=Candidatus Fimicola merdigallinarum TaxID=2840819 RepID=A0A9D9DWI8_9FIRM|nr:1-deoxy-D-xylulose-5-phosphate reductoisomerase [Candidatus Fimicola merdigallinarum]
MENNISILGSTGSIGTQALDVVRAVNNEDIKVWGITGNNNIDLLEKQALEFKPKIVAVMDEEKSIELKKRLKSENIKVMGGMEGLIEVATMNEVQTVLTSVVGNIGLQPTIEAIKSNKDIALANKETLVSAGQLVMNLAKEKGIKILPVDSEHSAIFQCIQGKQDNEIYKILLTASGGRFRGKTVDELKNVTVEEALQHPNWVMGKKITIDSSTLMNKGLEVIEAVWLFGVDVSQVQVVVHPQSIIHSAVEFDDGSIIAQMGAPDMRLPIQYALMYPMRKNLNFKRLDLIKQGTLTFEEPDMKTFKCLDLAFRAIKEGGTMPAVLNASNEIAVERFLNKEISFLQIPEFIEKAMNEHSVIHNYNLNDVLSADKWAREFVYNQSV